MLIQKFNGILKRTEDRLGVYLFAFVISLFLLLLASFYVKPNFTPYSFGYYFSDLSLHPFSFNGNPVQYRILTPLIAYCLFLRGDLFIIVPLIFGLLLLISIYIYFRKNDFDPLDASCITSLIAFSSPILFNLYFQGYVDTTSYFLIFLTYIFIEKRKLLPAFLFFTLSLFNHEVNLFMAPFFIWFCALKFRISSLWKPLLLLTFSIAVIMFFRRWTDSHAYVEFNNDLYFRRDYFIWNYRIMFRLLPLGIFMCFKLFWGLPILAILKKITSKSFKEALTLFFAILCGCAPLILSSDTSRIVGLSFLAILISVKYMKQMIEPHRFTKYLIVVIALNLLVPSYYIGQTHIIPFYPLPVHYIYEYFLSMGIIIE